jgi:hypothetical protein
VAGKVRGANWYLVEHAKGRGYVYGNLLEEPAAKLLPPAPPAAAQTTIRPAGTVFQDTLRDGSQGPEMVVIPAGRFSPAGEGDNNEHPQHRVTLAEPFVLLPFAGVQGAEPPGGGRVPEPTCSPSPDCSPAHEGHLAPLRAKDVVELSDKGSPKYLKTGISRRPSQ